MSDYSDDPIDHATRASELVAIFRRLGSIPNAYLDDGWATMLGVSKSSDEFYTAIGAVSRSLDQLKSEISQSILRETRAIIYLRKQICRVRGFGTGRRSDQRVI